MRLKVIVWILSGISMWLIFIGAMFLAQESFLEKVAEIRFSPIFIEKPPKTRLDFIHASMKSHLLHRANTPKTSVLTRCFPMTFGISETQDDKYFIIKNFSCPTQDTRRKLILFNEKFEMVCDDPKKYIYVGNQMKDELFGNYQYQHIWQEYSGPVDSKGTEFAVGMCGATNLTYLRNKYNPEAANRAKKIASELYAKQGITNPKPQTVLFLVIDSTSRQSFYRNLETTVKLLQEINDSANSSTKVYDFLLNQAMEFFTWPNMTPLVLGRELSKHLEEVNGDINNPEHLERFVKAQNKTSLWKEFERQGFVTMVTSDNTSDYFSKSTGRKLLADHVIGSFWRVVKEAFEYDEFTDGTQCISGIETFNYQLEYLRQYFENYKKLNNFAYMHINVAHEESCTRIRNFDQPLKTFLTEFIEEHARNNKEFILVLTGDHGRYFHPLTLEALAEKLLPPSFILVSKSIVERFGVHETLMHSSNILVTRHDWYATIKHFAELPYLKKAPDSFDLGRFLRKKVYNKSAKNLFF